MLFEVDQDVAASPETTFDAMADARNEPQWNRHVNRSDLLSGEPVGEGSRFETVNRGRPYQATITACERPGRLVFEVTGAQMDITATFIFTGRGDSTALHGTFDMRPKGLLRVLAPLMKPAMKSDFPKEMASFAQFVEGRTQSG